MIKKMDLAEWLDYDRAHPAPTFFARPAWSLALADVNPGVSAAPLRIDTGSVSVIVPTVQTHARLRFREHLAFPLGGYTCFLTASGRLATQSEATAAMRELAQGVDHARIIPWPLGPVPASSHATAAQHETAVIDCKHGFDAVMQNVRGVTRRMAGQAERRGVTCERASIAHLPEYYDILTEASQGWGLARPPVPYELLHAVLKRGGEDAQLWLAHVDGTTIGGGIIFFGSNELFFWSAAMRRDYSRFRPSNALNVALLQILDLYACVRPVKYYQGVTSPGKHHERMNVEVQVDRATESLDDGHRTAAASEMATYSVRSATEWVLRQEVEVSCSSGEGTPMRRKQATLVLFALLSWPAAPFGQSMNTLTVQEKAQGWQILFDGKTLAGWHVSAPPPASGRAGSPRAPSPGQVGDGEAVCGRGADSAPAGASSVPGGASISSTSADHAV